MTPTDSQAARLHEELARVLELLEKATDGTWYVEPMSRNEHGQHVYSVNMEGGQIPTVESGEFYGDPHDAHAACAAINFLRKHGAHIAETFKETPNG